MWLWIWACVGRTFIPDIFLHQQHRKKKNKHHHSNTKTPPHHHHTNTTRQMPPQKHNYTTQHHEQHTHQHTHTQEHKNSQIRAKLFDSICTCVTTCGDHIAKATEAGQHLFAEINWKKKSFHFTEGHSSRMPFFTCRSKQVCRARHGHLICRQNLQLIRKV